MVDCQCYVAAWSYVQTQAIPLTSHQSAVHVSGALFLRIWFLVAVLWVFQSLRGGDVTEALIQGLALVCVRENLERC